MELIFLALIVVILCFGLVVLFGAPYLPTLRPQVATALELINLQPGQHLLELGSGDGTVMLAAAKKGLRVTGYELNPLLVVISRIRTWRYRATVRVVWGNFWSTQLPDAEGMFTFLLPKYMKKLDNKITQEYTGKKVKLVSFAFEIPDKKARKQQDGVYLYMYE